MNGRHRCSLQFLGHKLQNPPVIRRCKEGDDRRAMGRHEPPPSRKASKKSSARSRKKTKVEATSVSNSSSDDSAPEFLPRKKSISSTRVATVGFSSLTQSFPTISGFRDILQDDERTSFAVREVRIEIMAAFAHERNLLREFTSLIEAREALYEETINELDKEIQDLLAAEDDNLEEDGFVEVGPSRRTQRVVSSEASRAETPEPVVEGMVEGERVESEAGEE